MGEGRERDDSVVDGERWRINKRNMQSLDRMLLPPQFVVIESEKTAFFARKVNISFFELLFDRMRNIEMKSNNRDDNR